MSGRNPIAVSIGTAGYAWPDWVGPFYPENLPAERRLAFYASHFPFVELHSTFHRNPSPGQLAALAEETPAGFQFSLKVPRTASHEQSVHDLRPLRQAADELAARHRLQGFVLEFPERFTDTPGHRDWVSRVAAGLQPYKTWVEFGNRSWLRPRLGEWLRDRGMELTTRDCPDSPDGFPRGAFDLGTRHAYVRLHPRGVAENPDAWLREWIGRISAAPAQVESVNIAFNTSHGFECVRDAIRLTELIRVEGNRLRLVEPASICPLAQGFLFVES